MGEITESEWSMQNEPLLRRQKRDVVKDGRSIASLLPATKTSPTLRVLDQPPKNVIESRGVVARNFLKRKSLVREKIVLSTLCTWPSWKA